MKKLSASILILYCILSSVLILSNSIQRFSWPNQGKDEISISDKRFAEMKMLLPPNVVVDYISDIPGKKLPMSDAILTKYFLAQYSLSPLIIASLPTGEQYVIGDYHLKGPFPEFTNEGFKKVQSSDHGLALFYRKEYVDKQL